MTCLPPRSRYGTGSYNVAERHLEHFEREGDEENYENHGGSVDVLMYRNAEQENIVPQRQRSVASAAPPSKRTPTSAPPQPQQHARQPLSPLPATATAGVSADGQLEAELQTQLAEAKFQVAALREQLMED